jgi:hypothetical protein
LERRGKIGMVESEYIIKPTLVTWEVARCSGVVSR